MSILKAGILSFINEALEDDLSGTDADRAIELTLADMSNFGLLVATDSTQTLSADDTYLDEPTGYRSALVIQLTNTDTSTIKDALRKLAGGMNEYRDAMASGSSNGLPEWYAEFDGKIYIYRPANANYSANIEYFKDHKKDADSIEYGDEFENCVMFGSVYHYAMLHNRQAYLALWGPKYESEKLLKKAVITSRHPYITRDY